MDAIHNAAIGIGSNLGEPIIHVRTAINGLAKFGEIIAISSLYRSEPWGRRDQPPFINAAIRLATILQPHALLSALKDLERSIGRLPNVPWGPRIIDLDILTYDDVRMSEPDLSIPHRYLFERAFALVPLAEIDDRYESSVDALMPEQRATVVKLPIRV